MKQNVNKLPSNKTFGLFFAFIFFALFSYFYLKSYLLTAYIFGFSSLIFFTVSLIAPKYLLYLNKIWMSFGQILGLVISPIVMGSIFFGLITPISIVTRIFGRDELKLEKSGQSSYWIMRESKSNLSSFKKQF